MKQLWNMSGYTPNWIAHKTTTIIITNEQEIDTSYESSHFLQNCQNKRAGNIFQKTEKYTTLNKLFNKNN